MSFVGASVFRRLVVGRSNSSCNRRINADLKTIGVGQFGESVGMIFDPNPMSEVRGVGLSVI